MRSSGTPAWDPTSIIVARLIQGAFGALLIPQGFGILGSVFPREHIGKAFSAFGPILGLCAVGGPLLAGVLIVGLVVFAAIGGLIYAVSLYLQRGLDYSPLRAAVVGFAPVAVGLVIASVASMNLLTRLGRKLSLAGIIVTVAGVGWLLVLTVQSGTAVTAALRRPGARDERQPRRGDRDRDFERPGGSAAAAQGAGRGSALIPGWSPGTNARPGSTPRSWSWTTTWRYCSMASRAPRGERYIELVPLVRIGGG